VYKRQGSGRNTPQSTTLNQSATQNLCFKTWTSFIWSS